MSRRNLNLLAAVVVVAALCYHQTARTERSRYRATIEALVDSLHQIDRYYLETVDGQRLLRGAMEGLAGQLDEHSAYIEPASLEQLSEALDQQFGGIGIQVGRQNEQLVVISPLVGSPAYKAGIQTGDWIVAIEDESTENFKLDDAVHRLRGRPGEPVRLAIRRDGSADPIEFRLIRDVIHTESVLGDTRNADDSWNFFLEEAEPIGYLRIVSFSERTAEEVRTAVEWLEERGADSLILDLRDNPGGLLKAAVDVCNLFVRKGRIVTVEGRGRGMRDEFDADGTAPFAELPLVVLVNQFSASASEIVAACLADHARAIIVGSRTWGKGSVQNVIELGGGKQGALKLTTASYWRPSGKNIHRASGAGEEDEWGVEPTPGFAIALSEEEQDRVREARRQRDVVAPHSAAAGTDPRPAAEPPSRSDAVLRKAVEYLESKSRAGEPA